MWNSIELLRTVSHGLMWSSAIFAVLAALSTGARYYLDRRASELAYQAQRLANELRDKAQEEREAVLQSQVEGAQRSLREADAKLSQFEGQVTPRRLTAEQQAALMHIARESCNHLPLINVTAAHSNSEAQRYALDFVTVLKAAGCKADLSLPIPGVTPDVTGIHIGVRNLAQLDEPVTLLSKMLTAAGVGFRVSPVKSDFFPEARFVLVIGAKDV